MNCNTIREFIAPYIDREVSADIQVQVDEHIEKCSNCRAELKAQLGVHRLLDEKLERVPASPELREKIIEKIAIPRVYRPLWLFKKIQFSVNPVAGFAVAAMLLFGVFFSKDIVSLFQVQDKYAIETVIPVSLPGNAEGLTARVVGKLVCVGCYLNENFQADFDCELHGHKIGFMTGDGNIWTFTHNQGSEQLMQDQDITGKKLEIDGQLYYSAHYIGIDDYRFLED